jgi:hypothetical protein
MGIEMSTAVVENNMKMRYHKIQQSYFGANAKQNEINKSR